jgi:Domain of unknown function (DUF4382)
MVMRNNLVRFAVGAALAGTLAACGGGGDSSGSLQAASPQSGTVPLIVSDASSDDWATIGVKIISIALVPQDGSGNVTVYTSPSTVPTINLEQLDQLGEILGNVSVPVGTYTGAVITVAGNPGDVILTASADPEAGFSLAAGASVASSNIEIMHTQGSAPSIVVPVSVKFITPLTVTTTSSNALDLEFDLSHPAFLVGHLPPGAIDTHWAVNFTGPVRHHPIADITHLVLRHMYGTVTAIASDNSSITITRDFPTLPVVSPETAITGSQSLSILADAANGTLLYDMDAGTTSTIKNFADESTLNSRYVRIAARYQENGTLVATRIWVSSSFANVWLSPEGHVLHVNTTTSVITIQNESGVGVPMQVDANTQFYFRQPASAVADATPIGTGPAFLASNDLVRGFKVHASAVDPLATPMVAQSIDIETADYSGTISQANANGFTYTRNFPRVTDDYVVTLDYSLSGYQWWNFAYPTLVDSGGTAVGDFVAATDGSVNFGGTAGQISAWGVSYAKWGDPANATGWSAAASVLLPVPVPTASVATALAAAGSGYSFTATAAGGTQPVTIDVSSSGGEATLVYQVDYGSGIVTISPVDITTAAGLTSLTDGLAIGAKVKISGIAQSDGTLKAYVLAYFTNTAPAD